VIRVLIVLALLLSAATAPAAPSAPGSDAGKAADPSPPLGANALLRRYEEGEKVRYRMKASNRGRSGTHTYEIQADGVVKKDGQGRFIEEFAWSNMIRDGGPVALPPAAAAFRQVLSLEPHYPMSVPDLSQVLVLVGPITDLLTFYADMSVKNQGTLVRPGDHFYFKHGTPASWADGNYVVLGQDSIDFDVTLTDVNLAERSALLTIRHVPPAQPQIKTAADWMREPVADTPNNWVEVTRGQDGRYAAEIGKETFDVRITISLVNGRILRASIDNPVEVKARECADAALTQCDAPVRYKILRTIEIESP
jgi:hypothetical protein